MEREQRQEESCRRAAQTGQMAHAKRQDKVSRMERINCIFMHPLYQKHFRALQEAEAERIFCRHTLEHFLDVARLMYIRSLEEASGLDRELIYAAALVHDIGRFEQIKNGIPHDRAGADLAGRILPECGFTQKEIRLIQAAVMAHRGHISGGVENGAGKYREDSENGEENGAGKYREDSGDGIEKEAVQQELLARYLYQADKQSRCCFACQAQAECYWPDEKKNMSIFM